MEIIPTETEKRKKEKSTKKPIKLNKYEFKIRALVTQKRQLKKEIKKQKEMNKSNIMVFKPQNNNGKSGYTNIILISILLILVIIGILIFK